MRTLVGLVLLALSVSAPAVAQTANPCDIDDPGPFVVTTGKSFTVLWCEPITEKHDGFYLQIDTGTKQDVGLPSAGSVSLVTNRLPYAVPSPGVQKGSHTATIIAYTVAMDANGNPTTQRLESTPAVIPFSAADPVIVSKAPLPPSGGRVIR